MSQRSGPIGLEIAVDSQQLLQKRCNIWANGPDFWATYSPEREKLLGIVFSFLCYIEPSDMALNSGSNVASRRLLTWDSRKLN